MTFADGLLSRPIALYAAFCALLCLSFSKSVAQEEQDPNVIWQRGFYLIQAARGDESEGNYLEAFNKLGEAKPIFDHLAQKFPDFYPEMVKGRRHLIAEDRDRVKQLMRNPAPNPSSFAQENQSGAQPPSVGTPIAPPPTPSYQARSREFEVTETDREVALPSWDEGSSNALPRVAPASGMPRVDAGRPSGGRPASVSQVANALDEDLRKKDSLIEWLNVKNQELRQQLDDRESELQRARAEQEMAQANYAQLMREKQLRESKGSGDLKATNKQLKEMLNNALGQLEEVNKLNEKLVADLGSSKDEIKKLQGRMEEVERERDNLLEVVRGEGNGGKALKELMDRNQQLTQQLDRAEKLASSLSELSKEKDEDIALLKSEISKIRMERDNLISENQRHQQSIDDLQKKLEMLSDGLTAEEKNALAQASPIERQENELLRSVVLKQLRRQAQMKQAKELLLRQLDKVGARSDTLLGLVEDMAKGSQLTEEEKKLFKSPQFQEIVDAAIDGPIQANDTVEGGSASVSATLIAPGNGPAADGVIREQKVTVELSQIDKSARLDFKEGRFSEAEAGFLEYLRYRPQSVSCLCNLGVLKIAMKNFSESEYYLNKALAIDSTSGLAHYLLGRTFFLQNKLDEALQSLEEGLTYDPQNAKAHNCVGVISSRKGWIERAQRAFTNAVSIDPEFGDAHFNLAVLFATRDQPDAKSAGKHYFRALHLGVPRDSTIEEFLEEAELSGLSIGLR